MDALRHVRRLSHVSLFRMVPGRHPTPRRILPGQECLELVVGGEGAIRDGDTWIPVAVGSLCWNVAGDDTIGRSRFDDPYRCLAVNIEVAPGGHRAAPRVTRWDDSAEVQAFTHRALRLAADPGADRDSLLAWLYGRLLLQARLHAARAAEPPLPPALRAVMDVIDGRFAEDLDIGALAAAAGWSPTQLHARFRRHLGTSPHQYLIRRRVRAACDLLAATRDPVAEIAVSAGFSSAHALCRAFRQHVGRSPAQWRARPG